MIDGTQYRFFHLHSSLRDKQLAAKMCEVVVLFDGYSKNLDDGRMDANCTCTLIKGSKLIIVDTLTAWDREKLIEGAINSTEILQCSSLI